MEPLPAVRVVHTAPVEALSTTSLPSGDSVGYTTNSPAGEAGRCQVSKQHKKVGRKPWRQGREAIYEGPGGAIRTSVNSALLTALGHHVCGRTHLRAQMDTGKITYITVTVLAYMSRVWPIHMTQFVRSTHGMSKHPYTHARRVTPTA